MNSQVKSVHYQILRVRVPLEKCLFAGGGFCMFTDALLMCIHWKSRESSARGVLRTIPLLRSLSLFPCNREGGRRVNLIRDSHYKIDETTHTETHTWRRAGSLVSLRFLSCTVRAVVTEMYSQPFFFTCPFNLPPTHLLSAPVPAGG